MKADERWRPVSQKPEQEVFDENYVDSAAASLSLSSTFHINAGDNDAVNDH